MRGKKKGRGAKSTEMIKNEEKQQRAMNSQAATTELEMNLRADATGRISVTDASEQELVSHVERKMNSRAATTGWMTLADASEEELVSHVEAAVPR